MPAPLGPFSEYAPTAAGIKPNSSPQSNWTPLLSNILPFTTDLLSAALLRFICSAIAATLIFDSVSARRLVLLDKSRASR